MGRLLENEGIVHKYTNFISGRMKIIKWDVY